MFKANGSADCQSCRGRGFKLESPRPFVLVGRPGSPKKLQRARKNCIACGGAGRAKAA